MAATLVVSCPPRPARPNPYLGSQINHGASETLKTLERMIQKHSHTASSQTLVSWPHTNSICVILALNIGIEVSSLF